MSSKDWLVPFQPTLTTLERPAPLRRKKRPAPHPNAQCKRPAAAMPRRLQPSSPFERTGFFPCGERCKKWWEPWKFSWFHMILVGGDLTILKNMKVNGKDYPNLSHILWKIKAMFQTTDQDLNMISWTEHADFWVVTRKPVVDNRCVPERT